MNQTAPQAAVKVETDDVTKFIHQVSEVADTMKNQLITTYLVTEIRTLQSSKQKDPQPKAEHAG